MLLNLTCIQSNKMMYNVETQRKEMFTLRLVKCNLCRGNGPEAYESQDGDIASSPLLGSRRPARTVSKLGMAGTARRPNSYT